MSSRTGITEGMQILRKFWDDLGRIALDAVMVPGKKTVFSENELTVREDVRDLALKNRTPCAIRIKAIYDGCI